MTTQPEAERYAAKIEKMTGNKHLVFHVPKGTMAHEMGWRFGTCLESERDLYANDGAVLRKMLPMGKAGSISGERSCCISSQND